MASENESNNIMILEALNELPVVCNGKVSDLVLSTLTGLSDEGRTVLYEQAIDNAAEDILKYYASIVPEMLTPDQIQKGVTLYAEKNPPDIDVARFSGSDVLHFIVVMRFLNFRICLNSNCKASELHEKKATAIVSLVSAVESLSVHQKRATGAPLHGVITDSLYRTVQSLFVSDRLIAGLDKA